jgi:hypothetical protein
MKKALLLVALSLAGCASWSPKKVIEVEIPVVAKAPPPPQPVRPDLPIALITPNTPEEEVSRLYVATIVVLQGYSAYLECLLRGYGEGAPTCRAPSEVKPAVPPPK